MKRLLILLLFAVPLAAQTPITTCNKTPPSVDQLCVTLTNGLGYDQVFAGNIADFLQAGAVASAVQVALLNAVRNQETADVKALNARIDAIPSGPQGIQGIPGTPGAPGTTPVIQVGTVTTVPATSPAVVTITGTPASPILNFSLPQGPQGVAGPGSGSQWVGVDAAIICKWVNSGTGFDPGLPGVTDKALGHISAGDCLQFPVPPGTNALAVAVSSPYGITASSQFSTAMYHFESPLGTRISATVNSLYTTNWWLYLTQIVPLTATPVGNVWWICDVPRLNIAGVKPIKQ